ncbi:redoxin family protein [Glaciecola siphonariae]|uniref:Redoxin family protein n=1 Tax=Glaciecola siphonariae TaxID=521012 RepID=A0ABV9LZX8_9ALTE
MSKTNNMLKKEHSKTPKWLGYLRDAAVLLIVIAAIMYWQTRDMLASDGSMRVQQQNLVSLNGNVVPLLAENKPTLVYFFAPWCSVCALSIGNLAYLDEHKINVVVIALDYPNREAVEQFVDEHDVSSTVLFGHDTLKTQFQIQGYPSYYLINTKQEVISKSYGYSTAMGLKLREVFGT